MSEVNFKTGETYQRRDGVSVTIITSYPSWFGYYGLVVKGDDGISRWDKTGETNYGSSSQMDLILPKQTRGALKIR